MTRVLSLMLIAGCGDPLAPIYDAEVLVTVEAPSDAARVSIRVWNEQHELVYDEWLNRDDLPLHLRLHPEAAPSNLRHARVEVEGWSGALCPFGRAVETYHYKDGEQIRATLRVSGSAPLDCGVLWVDHEGQDDECTEASPCARVTQAVSLIPQQVSPVIILVAGDGRYNEAVRPRSQASGISPDQPNILRSWPGRGTPRVDDDQGPLGFCCREGLTSTLGAKHFEVDGFEFTGGDPYGIELNGAETHDVTIRNCSVHGNGASASRREGAGIQIALGAHRIRLEHNHVFENSRAGGEGTFGIRVEEPNGAHSVDIDANRLHSNQSGGVRFHAVTGSASVTNNIVCQATGEAIGVEISIRDLVVTNNVLLVTDVPGIRLRDDDAVMQRNTILSERSSAIVGPSSVSPAPQASDNLLVGGSIDADVEGMNNLFWEATPVAGEVLETNPDVRFDLDECVYGAARYRRRASARTGPTANRSLHSGG